MSGFWHAKVENEETGEMEEHELLVFPLQRTVAGCDSCHDFWAIHHVEHLKPGLPFVEHLCELCTKEKTNWYKKQR